MAGLGFKDFQVGEVLTSSDVDGYLMAQAVMRFADSTARGSALGTATGTAVALAEGMITYLDSLNAIQVYDGSDWRDPSIGIGTNVVQTFKDDVFSTTSTTYTDITGLSVTINPSSATSKVLVIAAIQTGSAGSSDTFVRMLRDATVIGSGTGGSTRNDLFQYTSASATTFSAYVSTAVYLDSPGTTSATTYKLQAVALSGNTFYLNRRASNGSFGVSSSLTAIEVAA